MISIPLLLVFANLSISPSTSPFTTTSNPDLPYIYSYYYTSSVAACSGQPVSITKIPHDPTGNISFYPSFLASTGVYPDVQCGLLGSDSFGSNNLLPDTWDCCWSFAQYTSRPSVFSSLVNIKTEKRVEGVFCQFKVGQQGRSDLFVKRNECVPSLLSDGGSFLCNSSAVVLFQAEGCTGAMEKWDWRVGKKVSSALLPSDMYVEMSKSDWTFSSNGAVDRARAIKTGWVGVSGLIKHDNTKPTHLAAYISLILTVLITFLGVVYALHLCKYGINFVSCFRVSVQTLWLATICFRMAGVMNGGDDSSLVVSSLFACCYGLATLFTAFYTTLFLAFMLRPGVWRVCACMVAVIIIHFALFGSIYFQAWGILDTVSESFYSFFGLWRKFYQFWLFILFIYDLVPIYLVIYMLLKPQARNFLEIFRDIHAANSYFWLVAAIDVLCIILFELLSIVLTNSLLAGGDEDYVMLIHLSTLPEAIHVSATVYLTGAIRDVLQLSIKKSTVETKEDSSMNAPKLGKRGMLYSDDIKSFRSFEEAEPLEDDEATVRWETGVGTVRSDQDSIPYFFDFRYGEEINLVSEAAVAAMLDDKEKSELSLAEGESLETITVWQYDEENQDELLDSRLLNLKS